MDLPVMILLTGALTAERLSPSRNGMRRAIGAGVGAIGLARAWKGAAAL